MYNSLEVNKTFKASLFVFLQKLISRTDAKEEDVRVSDNGGPQLIQLESRGYKDADHLEQKCIYLVKGH